MKIAVMSYGNSKDSLVSERFARTPYIIIYDTIADNYLTIENSGSKSKNGAGPQTANLIINNKVDILLTKELGVKAYSVMAKEHIKIELIESGDNVESVIKNFLIDNPG